jgi:alpha-glucosidase (family GH31 glycosyl hydrolase)
MYKTSVPIDVFYSSTKLNYVTIGGVIHSKLFLGDDTPNNAVKKYHQYLDGWILHPFWTLGFHQSRWGYSSADFLINVINNYQAFDIPLDVIWSDLDYMADK